MSIQTKLFSIVTGLKNRAIQLYIKSAGKMKIIFFNSSLFLDRSFQTLISRIRKTNIYLIFLIQYNKNEDNVSIKWHIKCDQNSYKNLYLYILYEIEMIIIYYTFLAAGHK